MMIGGESLGDLASIGQLIVASSANPRKSLHRRSIAWDISATTALESTPPLNSAPTARR